jgi:hypothetical protein
LGIESLMTPVKDCAAALAMRKAGMSKASSMAALKIL